MKIKELREKSVSELNDELHNLLKEQFRLKMQKSDKNNLKPHLYKRVRRDIARIKTLINEKKQ